MKLSMPHMGLRLVAAAAVLIVLAALGLAIVAVVLNHKIISLIIMLSGAAFAVFCVLAAAAWTYLHKKKK